MTQTEKPQTEAGKAAPKRGIPTHTSGTNAEAAHMEDYLGRR